MMSSYRELKNLEDRIVVVTGASSGLGEQIAYQFAKRGAVVVAAARNMQRLKKVTAACCEFRGKKAYAIQMDIADPQRIETVIDQVERQIGPIDILINNAGFGLMQKAIDFDMDQAEKMFRVNVLGMMYLTKYTALAMSQRKRGAIVNIASAAGKISTPKSSVYSATKAAVIGYSDALRLELKPLGISVLTVNPGPIRTHFFDNADQDGNYLEKIKKIVLNPEMVAEQIVDAIGKNKREITLPHFFKIAEIGYSLFPKIGDYLTATVFNKK